MRSKVTPGPRQCFVPERLKLHSFAKDYASHDFKCTQVLWIGALT